MAWYDWSSVDEEGRSFEEGEDAFSPGNLQIDPKARGVNVYDQQYRDALANFQAGPAGEAVEELEQRTHLGKLQKGSFREMRSGTPLGAAQGLGKIVPYQQATAKQLGGRRAARQKARTGFEMGQLKRAGGIDQFKGAQATRRAIALADYNAQAKAASEDAHYARIAQWLTLGGHIGGKLIEGTKKKDPLPEPGTTGTDPDGTRWMEL